jgi:hypothetical protein
VGRAVKDRLPPKDVRHLGIARAAQPTSNIS